MTGIPRPRSSTTKRDWRNICHQLECSVTNLWEAALQKDDYNTRTCRAGKLLNTFMCGGNSSLLSKSQSFSSQLAHRADDQQNVHIAGLDSLDEQKLPGSRSSSVTSLIHSESRSSWRKHRSNFTCHCTSSTKVSPVYLTPSQKKDKEIRELKKSLFDLSKASMDKECEVAWLRSKLEEMVLSQNTSILGATDHYEAVVSEYGNQPNESKMLNSKNTEQNGIKESQQQYTIADCTVSGYLTEKTIECNAVNGADENEQTEEDIDVLDEGHLREQHGSNDLVESGFYEAGVLTEMADEVDDEIPRGEEVLAGTESPLPTYDHSFAGNKHTDRSEQEGNDGKSFLISEKLPVEQNEFLPNIKTKKRGVSTSDEAIVGSHNAISTLNEDIRQNHNYACEPGKETTGNIISAYSLKEASLQIQREASAHVKPIMNQDNEFTHESTMNKVDVYAREKVTFQNHANETNSASELGAFPGIFQHESVSYSRNQNERFSDGETAKYEEIVEGVRHAADELDAKVSIAYLQQTILALTNERENLKKLHEEEVNNLKCKFISEVDDMKSSYEINFNGSKTCYPAGLTDDEDLVALSKHDRKHVKKHEQNIIVNSLLEEISGKEETIKELRSQLEFASYEHDIMKEEQESLQSQLTVAKAKVAELEAEVTSQKNFPQEAYLKTDAERIEMFHEEELKNLTCKFITKINDLKTSYEILLGGGKNQCSADLTDGDLKVFTTLDKFKQEQLNAQQKNIEQNIADISLTEEAFYKEKTIKELRSRLEFPACEHDVMRKEQERLQIQLTEAKTKIADLESDIEARENFHQQTYLAMYKKGMKAAKFEYQCETVDGTPPLTDNIVVPKLLHQLDRKERELIHFRKEMYKRTWTDAEVTLEFMKDAFYYFLINTEPQEHLNAMMTLLKYNKQQRRCISEAIMAGNEGKQKNRLLRHIKFMKKCSS